MGRLGGETQAGSRTEVACPGPRAALLPSAWTLKSACARLHSPKSVGDLGKRSHITAAAHPLVPSEDRVRRRPRVPNGIPKTAPRGVEEGVLGPVHRAGDPRAVPRSTAGAALGIPGSPEAFRPLGNGRHPTHVLRRSGLGLQTPHSERGPSRPQQQAPTSGEAGRPRPHPEPGEGRTLPDGLPARPSGWFPPRWDSFFFLSESCKGVFQFGFLPSPR